MLIHESTISPLTVWYSFIQAQSEIPSKGQIPAQVNIPTKTGNCPACSSSIQFIYSNARANRIIIQSNSPQFNIVSNLPQIEIACYTQRSYLGVYVLRVKTAAIGVEPVKIYNGSKHDCTLPNVHTLCVR